MIMHNVAAPSGAAQSIAHGGRKTKTRLEGTCCLMQMNGKLPVMSQRRISHMQLGIDSTCDQRFTKAWHRIGWSSCFVANRRDNVCRPDGRFYFRLRCYLG